MHRSFGTLTLLAVLLVGCGGGGGDMAPKSGLASGASTPPNYSVGGTASVGDFVFVANSAVDSISEFVIDSGSGALLSAGPPVPVGRRPTGVAGTIDKKYLYVSNNGSNDVSAFAIDPNSGTLTPVSGSPFAAGTNPHNVAVYRASFSSSKGGGSGPISYRSYLFVTNTGSDAVSVYNIDQNTGALTTLPTAFSTGTGPTAMAVRPDGQFLYVANSGGSLDISAFAINGYYGDLNPVSGSPFPSGDNVSSLVFGAGEAFLYAASGSGGAANIIGFRVHPFGTDLNSGALTALPGFPLGLPSCNYIVSDQTGAFLYASAGLNVFGFSIDPNTGALSPISGFPVTVRDSPDSMSIDSTNQFLYVTSRGAHEVTGFKLNAATGALTAVPGSPFTLSQ
jgi:6-phosphogluconolactonase